MVLREQFVELRAIHCFLNLLGTDKDGESDPGENLRLVLVDANVEEGLHENGLAGDVDPALELRHQRAGAGPAADSALRLMVDTDGQAPKQVDPFERFGRVVHLLLELVDATCLPLLQEGDMELTDASEMGIEAAGGHAESRAQVGDGEGVHAAVGQQIQRSPEVVVLALAHRYHLPVRFLLARNNNISYGMSVTGEAAMSVTNLSQLAEVFVDPTAYAEDERFHAACQILRREHPVIRVESDIYRPFWAITRHADVLEIERDNEHFLNAPRPLLAPAAVEALAEAGNGPMLRTLIHMDDPVHKAFRAIGSSWFLPGRIRALEDRVRELAVRSIDHLAELGGGCDFVQEVAVGFPLHVILSILGLPEEDFPRMLQLTKELFGGDDDELSRSRDPEEQMAVLLDFFAYFMALTADRRANPTDDLASVIANASIDGELINDFDAASYYVIIATAGHDTTSSSIAGGLEALLRHPDQLARLRDDPSLGTTAVEEMIRWVTPVKEFMRTATEDRIVGGETIATGDSVYLAYLSANRDENVFDDPFRFDVARKDNKHLAFGAGVHFCLGAHLARLELRIFFEELLARVDQLELSGEPSRSATVFVGGLKHLPVSYRMR